MSATRTNLTVETVNNDDLAPNPTGSTSSDVVTGNAEIFIKRKVPFTISTFNARSLSSNWKRLELAHSASKHNIDVVCIQEHRLYHLEDLLKEKLGRMTFISSSATKNSVNSAIGGVGFLLSPKVVKAVVSFEKISDRILVMTLEGNPRTTIVCCYSPTNVSSPEDIDNFYNTLSDHLRKVPAHNMLFVVGDLNAKLGDDVALHTLSTATNRNGQMLSDLADQFNLLVLNTRFQKRKGKLWTFTYPNGGKAQIDFVLANKKWRNSYKDCASFNIFDAIGSDHRVVTCKCMISYRQSKPAQRDPMSLINWKAVARNSELQDRYAIAVHNRYESLLLESPDELSTDDKYKTLVKANTEISLQLLPKRVPKQRHVFSDNIQVNNAREQLKRASSANRRRTTRSSTKAVEDAKTNLEHIYNAELEKEVKQQTDNINRLHTERRSGAAWQAMKELTGKKSVPLSKIKGATKADRLSTWFNHFKQLLGPTEVETDVTSEFFNHQIAEDLPIETSPFTEDELIVCLKKLSRQKASGPDNIPASIWKHEKFRDDLLFFCNETYEGRKPSDLSMSRMIALAKKGDLSNPTNYRGITLAPIAAKIYNSLLLNRISKFVDPILRQNQNGFRKGRSTLPQILALRRIIEELKVSQQSAAIIFVDFSKAFDSVNRSAMLHILKLYGIPNQIIEAVRIMYDNQTTFVLTPDGPTDFFTTTSGILQGDTLAPYLFIIVVDYILRQSLDKSYTKGLTITQRRSSRHKSQHLTDLDYADDLALLSDLISDAQELLHSLEIAAEKVGLTLNEPKTECMILNADSSHPPISSKSGAVLKEVSDFKYLGSYVGDSRKDFETRKALAWKSCNKLHSIWQSSIPKKTKLSFFRASVESVLLYGSETWTMNREFEKRLDGLYTRLLMRVQNLNWKDHPTLADIYGDLPRISHTLMIRRLQFAGHCIRAPDQPVSDLVMWRLPYNKRGRRPLTYSDVLVRDCDIPLENLAAAMLDREHWKDVVGHLGCGRRK